MPPNTITTGNTLGSIATMPAQKLREMNIIKGVMVRNDQIVLLMRLSSKARWAL